MTVLRRARAQGGKVCDRADDLTLLGKGCVGIWKGAVRGKKEDDDEDKAIGVD